MTRQEWGHQSEMWRDRCYKTPTNRKQFHLSRHPIGCRARKLMANAQSAFCLHFKLNKKLYFNFRELIWKIEHYPGKVRWSHSGYLTHCNKWLCQHRAFESAIRKKKLYTRVFISSNNLITSALVHYHVKTTTDCARVFANCDDGDTLAC